MAHRRLARGVFLVTISLLLFSCSRQSQPKPGTVLDEARKANRPASSFPAADEDYFHDMDGALSLTPDEIKGNSKVQEAYLGGVHTAMAAE